MWYFSTGGTSDGGVLSPLYTFLLYHALILPYSNNISFSCPPYTDELQIYLQSKLGVNGEYVDIVKLLVRISC